ncbi:hypothetical protein [Agrobacterium sp. P15N1-A]|uniref:hypothetical protein n=1 Tax=Agrobacterium sp. P15N1-A TaxID=3342820 RepID=UPI0037DC070E
MFRLASTVTKKMIATLLFRAFPTSQAPILYISCSFSARSGVAVVPLPLIMIRAAEHLNEEDIEPMAA